MNGLKLVLTLAQVGHRNLGGKHLLADAYGLGYGVLTLVGGWCCVIDNYRHRSHPSGQIGGRKPTRIHRSSL